jgi:hypothetical protein
MRRALKRHPDFRCDAVTSIEVEVVRLRTGQLVLSYLVSGSTVGLLLPKLAASARRDELWQHTCFEAFLRAPQSDAYVEVNLSPSTEWAAYRFTGYREGMDVVPEVDSPRIEVEAAADRYELKAVLELGGVSELKSDGLWHISLTTVIEETSGRKSYWALAHPAGKPDFHYKGGFILDL